jgi:hypothetical protein
MGGVALPEQALPMKEVAAPEAAAVAVVPPGGAASSEKEGKTASSPMAPGAPEAALPMPEPLAPPPTLETKEGEKKPAPLPAPPAVVEEKPGPKPAELPPALPAAPAAVPEGPPMAASPVPMLPPAAPPAAPAVVSPAGPPEAALVKPAEIPLPKPEEVGVKPPAETAPPPAADAGMKTPMPALPAVVVPDRKDVLPASIEKPPSAAAPVAVTPPVVARTAEPRSATTQPVVESYTEQEYTVKQGETFATISKAKYGSEEYAEALRRHNLDDMFRSVPLDEKGGSIKPGQIVSIPDLQFLERRYANLLPKLSPLPEAKLDPKLTRAAAIASAGKTVAAVTEGPLYRVSAGGQTMREVASKILGDGERWNQVLRLNPTFRSDYALPAGSILTLPVGTKVPPENQVR